MDCRTILFTMISFLAVPFLCFGQQAGQELYKAAEVGDLERVRALLDQGAEVNYASRGNCTPLFWAASRGHEAIVRLLLARGAAVDPIISCNGGTPLFQAARNGHEAITRLLLTREAKVDHVDKFGWTSLFQAACCGKGAIARLLLEEGAVVDRKDCDGRTPLFWAANRGHETIARLLLAHDACLLDECKTTERQAFIAERGKAVGAFLGHIEEAHGLPRDVTRLIERFAARLSEEELPSAEY